MTALPFGVASRLFSNANAYMPNRLASRGASLIGNEKRPSAPFRGESVRLLNECEIVKALIDNNHHEHFLASTAHCAGRTERRPGEKQAMEMTEYGKHGKPRSRLPTLPTLFGNPFGIPTFPRPRRLGSCLLVTLKSKSSRRKGLVTDVQGPQRNACPGTLTP